MDGMLSDAAVDSVQQSRRGALEDPEQIAFVTVFYEHVRTLRSAAL